MIPCRHQNSWPGLSGSAPHHRRPSSSSSRCRLTKRCTRDRRSHPAGPTSKCWLMSRRRTTVGFLARPSAAFLSKGITCRRILSTTAPPTALETGERACRAWGSQPSAPSPTTAAGQRKAERFIKNHPAEWALRDRLPKHRMNATAGLPAILGSINAAGATWLSVGSRLSRCLQRLLIAE